MAYSRVPDCFRVQLHVAGEQFLTGIPSDVQFGFTGDTHGATVMKYKWLYEGMESHPYFAPRFYPLMHEGFCNAL